MKRTIQQLASQLGFRTSYSGKSGTMYVIGKNCKAFISSLDGVVDEELHFKLKGQVKSKGGK